MLKRVKEMRGWEGGLLIWRIQVESPTPFKISELQILIAFISTNIYHIWTTSNPRKDSY